MSYLVRLVPMVLTAQVIVFTAAVDTVRGQEGGCSSAGCHTGHGHKHCPPPFRHWQEGPVRIRYKRACPKPVCPPCELRHYGYYQPCWRPWPFRPDWSHCPVPPTATHIQPTPGWMFVPGPTAQPHPAPNTPSVNPQQLPIPRRITTMVPVREY